MSVMAVARLLLRLLGVTLRRLVPFAVLLLRLPWIVALAVPGMVRRARAAVSWPARLRAATGDVAVCRRCLRQTSLLARLLCPICKSVETTHAWAPCSTCRAKHPAGYITCANPDCGEAITNPTLGGEP